jgi:hypothetical protein
LTSEDDGLGRVEVQVTEHAHNPSTPIATLRFRLGRIRDISGRDFQDVDTRLSFPLATPVLDVIGWPLQIVGRPTGDQIPVDDDILATTVAPALH